MAQGLVVIERPGTGRGQSTTVSLAFADTGPWWEGEINVELSEAVLGYSTTRGPARLLLATMAAVADGDGVVRDLSTEQLCAAAGIADRTYRRARQELLVAGALGLVSGIGGRGNTNVWAVADSRSASAAEPRRAPRRVAPPAGAWPLLATAKGGHDRTELAQNGPVLTGVSVPKGGQDHTLFELPPAQTPAERAAHTPAETPAPIARGKGIPEPQNRGRPPSPPDGGSPADPIIVEQTYTTERGRRRKRAIRVDLDDVRRELQTPTPSDHADWLRIRSLVAIAVGESTFAIWLQSAELIAVDRSRRLVIAVPMTTAAWISSRFGGHLAACGSNIGRELRLAEGRAFRPRALCSRTTAAVQQSEAGRELIATISNQKGCAQGHDLAGASGGRGRRCWRTPVPVLDPCHAARLD